MIEHYIITYRSATSLKMNTVWVAGPERATRKASLLEKAGCKVYSVKKA